MCRTWFAKWEHLRALLPSVAGGKWFFSWTERTGSGELDRIQSKQLGLACELAFIDSALACGNDSST